MDSSRQTQDHDQDVPQAKGSGSVTRFVGGIAGGTDHLYAENNRVPTQAEILGTPEHQTFTSGAASSKQNFPHHMTPVAFLRRVAGRFGLGKKNYGDINYMSAVKILKNTHEIEVDVEFCRARWDHAFEHLLNVKEQGWLEDDNLSALAWFSAMAIRFETMGVDWHRILNPVFVNEQKIRFSTEPRDAGEAPKVTRVEYAPPNQDKRVWVEDQGQQAQQKPQIEQERAVEAVMQKLKEKYAGEPSDDDTRMQKLKEKYAGEPSWAVGDDNRRETAHKAAQQRQQAVKRVAQTLKEPYDPRPDSKPSVHVRPQRLQEREDAVMERLKKTYAEPTQGELGSVSHSWRTPIYAIVAGNPTLVEAKTLGTVGGLVLDALVQAKQDVTRSMKSWEIRDENGRSLSQTSLVCDVLSKGERVYINLAPGVGA